jgi:hypothetical protein
VDGYDGGGSGGDDDEMRQGNNVRGFSGALPSFPAPPLVPKVGSFQSYLCTSEQKKGIGSAMTSSCAIIDFFVYKSLKSLNLSTNNELYFFLKLRSPCGQSVNYVSSMPLETVF